MGLSLILMLAAIPVTAIVARSIANRYIAVGVATVAGITLFGAGLYLAYATSSAFSGL